jgi:hypothetical protein
VVVAEGRAAAFFQRDCCWHGLQAKLIGEGKTFNFATLVILESGRAVGHESNEGEIRAGWLPNSNLAPIEVNSIELTWSTRTRLLRELVAGWYSKRVPETKVMTLAIFSALRVLLTAVAVTLAGRLKSFAFKVSFESKEQATQIEGQTDKRELLSEGKETRQLR